MDRRSGTVHRQFELYQCMGYGGFTVEHSCHVAYGACSAGEMAQSSTWREPKAVQMT